MFDRIILSATNGESKGMTFVLENERDYILGRDADCSFVIADPFRLVSRRHCRIEVHAPFVLIQDLGSRNGTQINGRSIGRQRKRQLLFEDALPEVYGEHPLEDGDILQLAGYDFRVEFDPPSPSTATEIYDREHLGSGICAACS
jgi:pSer/pThr/pTyr-binding forkhead associated (FHA) protein